MQTDKLESIVHEVMTGPLDELGLENKPQGNQESHGIEEGGIATKQGSQNVVKLDKWGKRRGQDLLEESNRMREFGIDENEVADFFGAAFELEPQLEESCVDKRREDFFKTLFETPEYHELHAQTGLDELASEIAALSFAEQWSAIKKTAEPEDQIQKDIQNLKHIAKALNEAQQGVEELRAVANSFGHEEGSGKSTDKKGLAELFKKVRNNSTLHNICKLAGRYRLAARAKQRRKAIHGHDDMVGVILDDSIGRLLPHELAKLAMPEFEDDIMRRIVEKQAMCREWRGSDPVAQGPIIIAVDESGSMDGTKFDLAKALTLTMAWIAKHQKRWCGLIGFSAKNQQHCLVLPPNKWDADALLGFLTHFYNGGTAIPLSNMEQIYNDMGAPKGKTDIIMITDGCAAISDADKTNFLAWKLKAQCKMITLAIGCNADAVVCVSDEIHNVSERLGLEEGGIDKVLSI